MSDEEFNAKRAILAVVVISFIVWASIAFRASLWAS